MRKKEKRKKTKFPALHPKSNPKIRTEFIDIDYLDKLTIEEKEWLNKFMDEYNGANLDFKNLKKNLHNTKKLKKDCTDRVNARNRDVFAKNKAKSSLLYFDNLDSVTETSSNPEDAIIELIDSTTDDSSND